MYSSVMIKEDIRVFSCPVMRIVDVGKTCQFLPDYTPRLNRLNALLNGFDHSNKERNSCIAFCFIT